MTTKKITLTQTTVLADAPAGVTPVGIKFSLSFASGSPVLSDLTQSVGGVATWDFTSTTTFAPGTYTATCSAVDAAGAPVGPVGTLSIVVPVEAAQFQAPVAGGLKAVLS